jgi:hypothetical protein
MGTRVQKGRKPKKTLTGDIRKAGVNVKKDPLVTPVDLGNLRIERREVPLPGALSKMTPGMGKNPPGMPGIEEDTTGRLLETLAGLPLVGGLLKKPVAQGVGADASGSSAFSLGSGGFTGFRPAQQQGPIYKRVNVDASETLRTLLDERLKWVPGESASELEWKLRKKDEIMRKMGPSVGSMTPVEVRQAIEQLDMAYVPQEQAFQSFSPESQALLEQAYGGKMPMRRMAGLGDIDPEQAAALGAYLLVSKLMGRNPGVDVLQGIGMLHGKAQEGVDLQYQADVQEDEMRRKGALAAFQRLGGIEDFNAEQAGFMARDERTAAREEQRDIRTGARQEDADERKFMKSMADNYFRFLSSGDPARAAQVKQYVEAQTGKKLDDSFNELDATTSQAYTQELTKNAVVDRALKMERVIGARNLNEFDRRTLNDRVRAVQQKVENADMVLDRLEQELEFLPEKLRSQEAQRALDLELTRAKIKKTIADASKPRGAGGGGSKEEFDRFNKLGGRMDTEIGNITQEVNRLSGLKSDAARAYDQANTTASQWELEAEAAEDDAERTKLKKTAKLYRDQANNAKRQVDEYDRQIKDLLEERKRKAKVLADANERMRKAAGLPADVEPVDPEQDVPGYRLYGGG